MSLTRLGEQLVRLAARGAPAGEPAAAPLVQPREVLSWLVLAAAQERRHDRHGRSARLQEALGRPEPAGASPPPEAATTFIGYIGDHRQSHGKRYTPRDTDADFQSYIRRVESALNGAQFGYQVPFLHNVSWGAYRCFQQVVGPMLAAVGLRSARFNCFFGNYKRTPFGAHIDHHHLHAFQYVVHGTRRLHAWDVKQLLSELGEDRLLDVLDDPLAHAGKLPAVDPIEARPGDLLYWPGDRVHMVEADEPSLGVSIVFERQPWRPEDVPRRRLGRLIARPRAKAVTRRRSLSLVAAGHLAQLARGLTSDGTVEQLLLHILGEQTGRLFDAVPALREIAPIVPGAVLVSKLHPQFPIRWTVHRARVLFAANGHAAGCGDEESHKSVVRLLTFLNEATQFHVAPILDSRKIVGALSQEDVCMLLTFFVSAGAFDLAG